MLYILHQVNCQGAFGAGFARYISDNLPEAGHDYRLYVDEFTREFPRAELLGGYHITKFDGFAIVHVFSQFNYGNSKRTGKCYTDLSALDHALDCFREEHPDATAICPQYMGAGLAGGNWSAIRSILTKWSITPCSNIDLVNRTYRISK